MSVKKLANEKLVSSSLIDELLVFSKNKFDGVISSFIELSIYTGLRSGELIALKFSDINGDGNLIMDKRGGSIEVHIISQAKKVLNNLRIENPESIYIFQLKNDIEEARPIPFKYVEIVLREFSELKKVEIRFNTFRRRLCYQQKDSKIIIEKYC